MADEKPPTEDEDRRPWKDALRKGLQKKKPPEGWDGDEPKEKEPAKEDE